MKAAPIELRAITKRYGDVIAVDDVSFSIAPSTLVTLLGPSGCGKTTLLRIIAGLELPSSGQICIGNVDVTRVPAAERDVSMVFQSYALFPHMTVLENVGYGLTVSGLSKRDVSARAHTALDTVGLTGLDQRLPSELSGGQQQRVAVARALVLEPAVLLFDEPLSNLDTRLRRQMRDEIRDLQQRLGLTAVYVTHDHAEALAVSDRIIVMNKARLAQEGSPRELYQYPRDLFVASFIGEANHLRGRVRETHTGTQLMLGPLEIPVVHRSLAEGEVNVAIRPNAIRLESPTSSGLRGIVRKSAYVGSAMEYTVDCALGPLFAVDRNVARPLAVGSEVGINLDADGVITMPIE